MKQHVEKQRMEHVTPTGPATAPGTIADYLNARGGFLECVAISKCIGTASGILGAIIVALKSDAAGYGFIFLALSAVCWTVAAWLSNERSLMFLQSSFIVVNFIGIYTWLIA